jgi:lipopolysaccharide transport system ATP-binding protein
VASAGSVAIRAEGLSKQYRIDRAHGAYRYRTLRDEIQDLWRGVTRRGSRTQRDTLWALQDVSFELRQGEALGIIGRNGAGKSTLLKVLSRITEPTRGSADVFGRTSSLLEVGSGFHPELTGRENIFLNGAVLGMTRHEIRRKLDQIVEFAEVQPFVETPVKRYSSGMYLRLAFAVAAHLESEILVIDETLSVGDAAFQRRCIDKMKELGRQGRTLLFVSHNMGAVEALCAKACRLDGGRLVDWGDVSSVVGRYLAEVASAASVPLAQRRDRAGEGAIRLLGLRFESADGQPAASAVAGRDLAFCLDYEARDGVALEGATFALAVYTLEGSYLFQCNTDLVGANLAGLPRRGTLRCTVPRLPLSPGTYSVNLAVRRKAILEDWITEATVFTVEPGDFFGTGELPPASHCGVLVDHEWRLQ